MSRSAAARIASRVVLPSRVLAAGLWVSVGVLVIIICTNRSVQKATPHEAPRQARDRTKERQAPRSVTAPPGVRHRGASRLRRQSGTEERHGSAGTPRAAPGVKGALLGPLRRADS